MRAAGLNLWLFGGAGGLHTLLQRPLDCHGRLEHGGEGLG